VSMFTRALFRVARWIAGRARTEWLDAMAAEAESIKGDTTAWALGCLWAAISDRAHRDWRLALAILLIPICINLLEFALFFPVFWLSHVLGLPAWTFVVVFILLPLPFAFALGRRMELRRALLASTLSSLILNAIGILGFWMMFGQGPEVWFEKGSQVYNMTPILGWTCSLCVWLAGAWLGLFMRRRARVA